MASPTLWLAVVTLFGVGLSQPNQERNGRFFDDPQFWNRVHQGISRVTENLEQAVDQIGATFGGLSTRVEGQLFPWLPDDPVGSESIIPSGIDGDSHGIDEGLMVEEGESANPEVLSKSDPFMGIQDFPMEHKRPPLFSSPLWPFAPPSGMNLFNLLPNRQWWKGPNVCVDRAEIDEGDEAVVNGTAVDEDGFLATTFGAHSVALTGGFGTNHGQMEFSTCRETRDKYTCRTRTTKFGINKTVKLTYRCCHGFIRDVTGCLRVDLRPLPETLSKLGSSDFLMLARSTNFLDSLQRENMTLFAPSNEAFQEFTADLEERNDIYNDVETAPSGDAVSPSSVPTDMPSVFRSHVIPGFLYASDMQDEQMLLSVDGSAIRINSYSGIPKVLTVNCARIVTVNQHGLNGVVHSIDRVLNPVKKTVTEIISEDPQFSIFNKLINKAGIDKNLDQPNQFTLFAPTDAAFKKMDRAVLNSLLDGNSCVQAVVRNHILPNVICSAAVINKGKSINLLQDYLILERRLNDRIYVNDAKILVHDIMATNGVIHVIDAALIPEQAQPVLKILKHHNLTRFLDLAELAEMTSEISNMKTGTIFAPSNEAIEAASLRQDWHLIENDKGALRDLIHFHMGASTMQTRDFINNQKLNTISGHPLRINLFTSKPLLSGIFNLGRPRELLHMTAGCSKVSTQDNRACGVIVHVVEDVMRIPKANVIEELRSQPDFSIFLKMIEDTNMTHILKEDGSYTILAPSDHVFRTLPEDELKLIIEDGLIQEEFVMRHILREQICCSGISPNTFLFMDYKRALDGSAVHVRKSHSGLLMAGSARITHCGFPAHNGVVHRINSILLNVRPQRRPAPAGGGLRRHHIFSAPKLDFLFGI